MTKETLMMNRPEGPITDKRIVSALTSVAEWLESYDSVTEYHHRNHGFDFGRFLFHSDEVGPATDYRSSDCGTACCIAGKIYLDNRNEILNDLGVPDGILYIEEVGKWLGLTKEETHALFYASEYQGNPGELITNASDNGDEIELSDVTPKKAASVIRGFLNTGKVTWA